MLSCLERRPFAGARRFLLTASLTVLGLTGAQAAPVDLLPGNTSVGIYPDRLRKVISRRKQSRPFICTGKTRLRADLAALG